VSQRIEDYGLLGDTHTAALIGRDGSVDWLCFPRFDSGACFAALLGDEGHGRWLLAPAGGVRRVSRRYRPGTLVLETEFETDEGTVRVVDCMPPRQRHPNLVRIVEGVAAMRDSASSGEMKACPDRLPLATDPLGKAAQPVSIERRRVGLDRPAASSSRWKSRRLRLRSNPAYKIAGA
jgi:hypothetical protein